MIPRLSTLVAKKHYFFLDKFLGFLGKILVLCNERVPQPISAGATSGTTWLTI
jgi:hypothetical protein